MPHPKATTATETRVQVLVKELLESVERGDKTVAELASAASLGHETVRRLYRNPGGANRYGPGFFVVAAIARASGRSLDDLANKCMGK